MGTKKEIKKSLGKAPEGYKWKVSENEYFSDCEETCQFDDAFCVGEQFMSCCRNTSDGYTPYLVEEKEKKKPLDKFHFHEYFDRTYICCGMIEDYLHKNTVCNDLVRSHLEDAISSLLFAEEEVDRLKEEGGE